MVTHMLLNLKKVLLVTERFTIHEHESRLPRGISNRSQGRVPARGFVDDLTRINKGRAFYTRPDRLGEYLLVDYLSHQRKKV